MNVPEPSPTAWRDARRVLAVRLDGAGDVLMTTPALRALKEQRPDRHVTLLASPAGAAVGRLVPEVDEVIEYVAPWMKPEASSDPRGHLEMVEALRARAFDAAAIFTVYTQSPHAAALLCTLAGIPLRLAHSREKPYGLLSDWVPETEPESGTRHEVRRQLDLVASVGAGATDERLSLRSSEAAREHVREVLRDASIDDGEPWCVLHPGATAASRRYPLEHFARVLGLLSRDHRWRVVLAGGPNDQEAAASLASVAPGAMDLAGRLSLEETAALVGLAPVVICNNSLPAHLAAAAGTPVVDLYALTNPQHTPWAVRCRVLSYDVPCRNCYSSVCPQGHHDCLRQVTPEEVVDAALSLVEPSPAPDPEVALLLPVVSR